MEDYCIFCQIVKCLEEAYIIHQDDVCTIFLDHDPINEGHVLIVTNKHYFDLTDLDDKVIAHVNIRSKQMLHAMQKLYPHMDGYSIMQNGGIYNDLQHYHLHIFPRYQNDGFSWMYKKSENKVNTEIAVHLKSNFENIIKE